MHPETASSPCVEMHGITKKFGTVLANDNASLSVNRGEILSLLGENGSGKTTLVNILAGIYLPDSGFVSIDRKECRFRSPHNAIAAGIGMVHQHYKLIPVMNVWENISLGNEHAGRRHYNPFIKKKQIIKKISAFEEQFGLKLNHYKKIYNMSIGEKQTVELLKLLFRGAQILILDEPTAVLTPQEIKKLFFMLRKMKQEGCAIIIITHKLNEVMEISDRVTVMRKGKTVETVATGLTNPRQLAGMMVGTSVSLEIERAKPKTSENPVLEVKNLCCRGQQKELLFDGISFNLYSGEILGLAGIAGGGQNELCETIAGIRKASAGEIKFHGEGLLGLMLRKTGKKEELMSYLPEDRLGMGLVGNMSIADNILLRYINKTPGIFVSRSAVNKLAQEIVERYNISSPSIHHKVRMLSGGNIQKVLLGREISLDPSVLIAAYPVHGLDIHSSYYIYNVLNEQKKKGVAILYAGEDLDVLMELCDRLMIFCNGKLAAIVDPQKISKEDIGLLMMTGIRKSA